MTAIGEDISAGIRTDRRNSIILEGFSDYLWLNSMKILLNIEEVLYFIPAVGASQTVHVGSILFGWGLDPIFILDNDEAGNNAKKKLVEKLQIQESQIIQIPKNETGVIENLFSIDDFEKYANFRKDLSKTLLAQQFLNNVKKGDIQAEDLDQTSIVNFQEVFDSIMEILNIEK